MRKTLGTVLLAGVFLLLLSALVVTPEDTAPAPEQLAPPVQAAFVSSMSRADPVAAASAEAAEHEQAACAMGQSSALAVLVVPGARDSNGRILRGSRYEKSVYQVFRPEVAGG